MRERLTFDVMKKARVMFPAYVALVALSGCPDGGDGKSGPCDPDVVRYDGYATDETCVTMVDAEDAASVTPGTANAPVLVSPTDGAVLVTTSAITITFDTPLDLDLVRAPRPATRGAALAARAARLLVPAPVAYAHEAPVTGAIHRLRFTGIGGSEDPVDVYTSKMAYTLDDELLADVAATDDTITLELTSMYVTQNLINNASTDGPFRMTPNATFSVP